MQRESQWWGSEGVSLEVGLRPARPGRNEEGRGHGACVREKRADTGQTLRGFLGLSQMLGPCALENLQGCQQLTLHHAGFPLASA